MGIIKTIKVIVRVWVFARGKLAGNVRECEFENITHRNEVHASGDMAQETPSIPANKRCNH